MRFPHSLTRLKPACFMCCNQDGYTDDLNLFRMKSISLILLLGSTQIAFAQTPAASMLPDGSTDTYLGLGVLSEPSCELGGEQKTRIMPNVQMQWSNGVFLRNTNLGMHFSKSSEMEYGPLLAYQRGCSSSAARKLAGFGDIDGSFQLGGFFNVYPRANLRLSSKLLFGTGAGKNTNYLNLEARSYHKLASHHGMALSAGFTWSKRFYDASGSSFDPETTALSNPGFAVTNCSPCDGASKALKPVVNTNADVRNVYLGLNWNWEFSSSWLLTSHITASHQLNTDKDSLWLGKRDYVTVYSGLAYRF